MGAHTKLILLTLFCAFLGLSLAQNEKCEECMAGNDAYCVDKTSYYFCMDGKPMKSQLMKCPEGQVCTKSSNICEKESAENKPLCSSSCNTCSEDDKFTCVSKTQFGRCINKEVTLISSCEAGSMCSTDLINKGVKQMCAPTCVLDFFGLSATCSNDEPITTTVAPPTTPNPEDLKAKCKAQTSDKTVYYVSDDTTCKTYIYCEKTSDGVEAILMKCPSGYFDINEGKCVTDKPTGCN